MRPLQRGLSKIGRRLRAGRAPRIDPALEAITPEDRRYLRTPFDDSVPLRPGAEKELRVDNPRLKMLRHAYAALDLPVCEQSRWNRDSVDAFLDLRYFRGDTLITWHYRESRRVTELKYFLFWRYVREHDHLGLLDKLEEDGAFGCWTFSYPGSGRISRDLLQSVGELSFLDRTIGLANRLSLRILDIGAGYGRLAHRTGTAFDQLTDYCCVDAIPESTFLCEYYLNHRRVMPPCRIVPLHELDGALKPGSFDLAVNVHSFSECTHAAVTWWLEKLRSLRVPQLLLVPNEPTELLSLEADGTRRDFVPQLEEAGYRLSVREPVIGDPAVRSLLQLEDQFHLFER